MFSRQSVFRNTKDLLDWSGNFWMFNVLETIVPKIKVNGKTFVLHADNNPQQLNLSMSKDVFPG